MLETTESSFLSSTLAPILSILPTVTPTFLNQLAENPANNLKSKASSSINSDTVSSSRSHSRSKRSSKKDLQKFKSLGFTNDSFRSKNNTNHRLFQCPDTSNDTVPSNIVIKGMFLNQLVDQINSEIDQENSVIQKAYNKAYFKYEQTKQNHFNRLNKSNKGFYRDEHNPKPDPPIFKHNIPYNISICQGAPDEQQEHYHNRFSEFEVYEHELGNNDKVIKTLLQQCIYICVEDFIWVDFSSPKTAEKWIESDINNDFAVGVYNTTIWKSNTNETHDVEPIKYLYFNKQHQFKNTDNKLNWNMNGSEEDPDAKYSAQLWPTGPPKLLDLDQDNPDYFQGGTFSLNLRLEWNYTKYQHDVWDNDPSHYQTITRSNGSYFFRAQKDRPKFEPKPCRLHEHKDCKTNYNCLCVGGNPDNGLTSFDDFFHALLTSFRLIALDAWGRLYMLTLHTSGEGYVSFYVIVVFLGSYYLINLILAVVYMAYEEEVAAVEEELQEALELEAAERRAREKEEKDRQIAEEEQMRQEQMRKKSYANEGYNPSYGKNMSSSTIDSDHKYGKTGRAYNNKQPLSGVQSYDVPVITTPMMRNTTITNPNPSMHPNSNLNRSESVTLAKSSINLANQNNINSNSKSNLSRTSSHRGLIRTYSKKQNAASVATFAADYLNKSFTSAKNSRENLDREDLPPPTYEESTKDLDLIIFEPEIPELPEPDPEVEKPKRKISIAQKWQSLSKKQTLSNIFSKQKVPTTDEDLNVVHPPVNFEEDQTATQAPGGKYVRKFKPFKPSTGQNEDEIIVPARRPQNFANDMQSKIKHTRNQYPSTPSVHDLSSNINESQSNLRYRQRSGQQSQNLDVNFLFPALTPKMRCASDSRLYKDAAYQDFNETGSKYNIQNNGVIYGHVEPMGAETRGLLTGPARQPISNMYTAKSTLGVNLQNCGYQSAGFPLRAKTGTLPFIFRPRGQSIIAFDDAPSGIRHAVDIFGRCTCFNPKYKKYQDTISDFVKDPFFEVIITVCILMNTLVLMMEQYPPKNQENLEDLNFFFTLVFTFEMIFKILGLTPIYYFKELWNVFDACVVMISLTELLVSEDDRDSGVGLTVLRTFRLLRILKLAKSWPTLNKLLRIIARSLGNLGHLTLVLIIVLFIFAVVGMQLLRSEYDRHFIEPAQAYECWKEDEYACGPKEPYYKRYGCDFLDPDEAAHCFETKVKSNFSYFMEQSSNNSVTNGGFILDEESIASLHKLRFPRWHFFDFEHSLMVVFRIICGEWVECMFDCINVGQPAVCVTLFVLVFVIGNLVILNLFLALLLNSFSGDALQQIETTDNSLIVAWERIKKWCLILRIFIKHEILPSLLRKVKNLKNVMCGALSKLTLCTNCKVQQKDKKFVGSQPYLTKVGITTTQPGKIPTFRITDSTDKMDMLDEYDGNVFSTKNSDRNSNDYEKVNLLSKSTSSSRNNKKSETSDSIKHSNDLANNPLTDEEMPDCCTPWCSNFLTKMVPKNIRTKDLKVTEYWHKFRKCCYNLIEHKTFEMVVIFLILLSSLSLIHENVYLRSSPGLMRLLQISDLFFTSFFTIEMILKWFGYGFRYYFTNAWCLTDFIIVVISILSHNFSPLESTSSELPGGGTKGANFSSLRVLRTLRAMRPLRALSRCQSMRVVVDALLKAIPSIGNVFLVCMIFWLIFSILGVNIFSGSFGRCVNMTNMEILNRNWTYLAFNETFQETKAFKITNKTECMQLHDWTSRMINSSMLPGSLGLRSTWEVKEIQWIVPGVNFDNVGRGYLALVQVATFMGKY